MGAGQKGRWVLVAASLAAAFTLGQVARAAEPLRADEQQRLAQGDTVSREISLDQGGLHLIGGLSYGIVDAAEPVLESLIGDVDAVAQILPMTRGARWSGEGQQALELRQGNFLIQTTYTVRLERHPREVKFWLDLDRPRDIREAWGFFRWRPLEGEEGRWIVTWGVLVDLGPGLLQGLMAGTVQSLALSIPQRLQKFLKTGRKTN